MPRIDTFLSAPGGSSRNMHLKFLLYPKSGYPYEDTHSFYNDELK